MLLLGAFVALRETFQENVLYYIFLNVFFYFNNIAIQVLLLGAFGALGETVRENVPHMFGHVILYSNNVLSS